MVYLMLNWVVSALSLFLLSSLAPGFRVLEFQSALTAAGVVGLISAALGMLLKYTNGTVSLAMSALFLVVVDAFLFRVSGLLVPGFAMLGFVPAFAGAFLLLLINLVLLRVATPKTAAFDSELRSDSELLRF